MTVLKSKTVKMLTYISSYSNQDRVLWIVYSKKKAIINFKNGCVFIKIIQDKKCTCYLPKV